MPHRQEHAPKHRNTSTAPAFGKRLRTSMTLTGVAVAATGVALTSGVVTKDEAPADTSVTSVTVSPAERVEQAVPTVAVAPLAERRNEASRSDRRTSLDSGRNSPSKKSPTEADPRAIARKMLPKFGFAPTEFGCLDALYVSESDWEVNADNPTSTAYGIPQALMSAHELPADYTTNATTQIRWGLGYIRDSYDTPCAAWEFKQGNDYY